MPYDQRPTRGVKGAVWHDAKALDGFTVGGWRRVSKGGYVRLAKGKHFHETMAGWVGKWVYVEVRDCWAVNVNVWPNMPWVAEDALKQLCCVNETDWQSAGRHG